MDNTRQMILRCSSLDLWEIGHTVAPDLLFLHTANDHVGSDPQQENGRRQKQALCDKFDSLYAILEERKKELVDSVSREQDRKLRHVRGLLRRHGDHLEASVKLVETAIQSMEEPQMAVFLQVCVCVFEKGCPLPFLYNDVTRAYLQIKMLNQQWLLNVSHLISTWC